HVSCNPSTGACDLVSTTSCNDTDLCTLDACDTLLGCQHQPTELAAHCSDGNACNGKETCNPATGTCQPGSPPVCNDNDACTTDSCDPLLECVHTPTATAQSCDDHNACNGFESCNAVSGACQAGVAVNCDDGNPCTDDVCDPSTAGCSHLPKSNG